MEARGIEPRSENRSTTASTGLAYQLRSPGAGRQATHPWTSSLEFRPAPESAPRGYPEFAIPMKPPQASFPMGRCGKAEALRSHCQVVVGSCDFPECFTRDPSTWARGHSFTNPVEASRPRNSKSNRAAGAHQPSSMASKLLEAKSLSCFLNSPWDRAANPVSPFSLGLVQGSVR